jgi:hypothetical protein
VQVILHDPVFQISYSMQRMNSIFGFYRSIRITHLIIDGGFQYFSVVQTRKEVLLDPQSPLSDLAYITKG